ncbi:MAG: class I SAM-dependent methyltransferase [Pseudomonadota bacterium]
MADYREAFTAADYRGFEPNAEILRYLEEARARLGLTRGEMNVLDYGAGRGSFVLRLREAGYNAYGADVDLKPAGVARPHLAALGLDVDDVVRVIDANGRTGFPDGYFHFVFTHYVLEHVAALDPVTREIARVTAPGGEGFHVYPGQYRPIEAHLYMPLVHWLPKNGVRRALIGACVRAGIEPHWPWLDDAAPVARADAYHQYTVDRTFYRSYDVVRGAFVRDGLAVEPVVLSHPKLATVDALPGPLRHASEAAVLTFKTVQIVTRKPTAPVVQTMNGAGAPPAKADARRSAFAAE